NVLIHLRQNFIGNLLDFLADWSVAAHDIEILPVQMKIVPHELCERFNLKIIFRAHNCVYVETKSSFEFIFQRIKPVDAIECLFPMSRHAANAIMSLTLSIKRDVQVQIQTTV